MYLQGVLASVPNPIANRTLMIVILAILLAGRIVRYILKRRNKLTPQRESFLDSLDRAVVTGAAAAAFSGTGNAVGDAIRHGVEWVIRKLGLQLTQILVALFVTAFGVGAYWFKKKNQKWYGAVEVLVGMLSAGIVAGTLGPNKFDLAKWATLAGSAYVIARGLGNYSEGKAKLPAPAAPEPAPADP